MNRIETLCSYLEKSGSFADVGCDHGYCAEYALKSLQCGRVYISDISAKCLDKAVKLLRCYVESGACVPLVCDGLDLVPQDTEQVLIAGMGGEEIISILKKGFIPAKFVFQPMKNADKLRKYLLDSGCKILRDDIFFDKKYYFIIKGERFGGGESYGEAELAFGRDSVKNPLIRSYAASEIAKREQYLKSCSSPDSRGKIAAEIQLLKGVLL